jgi:putative selenate reductase
MSDKFMPVSMEALTHWVFEELDKKNSIFGIPKDLFFTPESSDKFSLNIYGSKLDTPFGLAAGPHTQMAQNIIVAWLCGGRFIELKTVQTLDELEVSKPCIDILDVGYNVEWSQELTLTQSIDEYVRAWVIIHALHKKLGFEDDKPGIIYSTSVGYNMEGILQDNVQNFLKKIVNSADMVAKYTEIVAKYCPEVKDVEIPAQLSNNVTLSTMHGCPPDEIGKIASYLIQEWGFHTNVKLNPTLLGPETLRGILNKELGFREITVPDIAFEHDLKYPDALLLLRDLQAKADEKGVIFGVKLSNTLEVENHRDIFKKEEKMMYLSGRPLQGVTVNLAKKLSTEFNGQLLMSYAGGADCFNVAELLCSGMKTITVCSDVLRPGGYTRMLQYIENTAKAYSDVSAKDTDDYICKTAKVFEGYEALSNITEKEELVKASALLNLQQYGDYVLSDPLLFRDTFERKQTKTSRELGLFDCIKAPCTDECPISQKAAQYIECVDNKDIKKAAELIREDNPIPNILGRACNHQCETTCTRTHYDEPIAIRELKRYIMDSATIPTFEKEADKNINVAVIGAGPCGLSTAYFLLQKGYSVTIFEEKPTPAGMVNETIPLYRAIPSAISSDIDVIKELGVKVEYSKKIGTDITISDLKSQGFKYIVIAAGAQKGMALGIKGEESEGVIDGIEFLRGARKNRAINLGASIAVIGAGDVAMDCARVANRLTGGKVSVVYRRTIEQMPAHKEELDGLLEEGIEIKELSSPKEVISENGKIKALRCAKMRLGEPDASGRRRPVEIPGEEFDIELDNLIIAIGQQPDFDFFDGNAIELNRKGYINVDPQTMSTSTKDIFAGGDAIENGPLTIVKACDDGKKIAASIEHIETDAVISDSLSIDEDVDYFEMLKKKSYREFRVEVPELPVEAREGFDEVIQTLSYEDAAKEASRCLKCHTICSTCTTVCPNRAIFTYRTIPMSLELPVFRIDSKKLNVIGSKSFELEQKYQTAIFTAFCNECANCASFCPTAGSPYKDKPRFYTEQIEFDGQDNNAFMLFDDSIIGKFNNEVFKLTVSDSTLICSNNMYKINLNRDNFNVLSSEALTESSNTESLKSFAIMYALYVGVKVSKPGMPIN